MVDFSSMSRPVYLADMGKDVTGLFDSALLLEDVRFSDDDRFYRPLAVGEDTLEVQFKYTTLTFDVAYVDEDIGGIDLWVRLREGGLYISGDAVPAIGYQMSPHRLWTANLGLPCEEDGHVYWEDSYLPVPLVFEPTGEVGEPNPRVVVV